jgi:uncharacterized protein YggE
MSALIALSAVPFPHASAQDRVSGQRASISASGRAIVKQNRGWVEIYVSAEEKDAAAALATHAISLKSVLEQVAAKGLTGQSVDTGLLAIRPRYEVKRDGNREIRGALIGYMVTKPVYVFIDAPDKVAAFVAQFPLAGPVRIGNVGFYVDNANAAQSAAIADSIARAQVAGETAARATNRKIGAVSGISININDRIGGRPPVRAAQPWQHNQVNPQNEDALSKQLVLEPAEETIQQQVNLELLLR